MNKEIRLTKNDTTTEIIDQNDKSKKKDQQIQLPINPTTVTLSKVFNFALTGLAIHNLHKKL